MRDKKEGAPTLHFLMLNTKLLENMEEQRVSMSSLHVSAVFWCLLQSLEKPALSISMPGITERMGGAFSFCLFWWVFFPFGNKLKWWSNLELALCQAVTSELQTAWWLSSGEGKSCAFTQKIVHYCCCLAFWFPGKKKNKGKADLVQIAPCLQWSQQDDGEVSHSLPCHSWRATAAEAAQSQGMRRIFMI